MAAHRGNMGRPVDQNGSDRYCSESNRPHSGSGAAQRSYTRHESRFRRLRQSSSSSKSRLKRRLSCPVPMIMEGRMERNDTPLRHDFDAFPASCRFPPGNVCIVLLRVAPCGMAVRYPCLIAPISKGGCSS